MMIDYKQTPEGDLDLSFDDFQWVESTGQHQRDIMLSKQGWYKESPLLGVDTLWFLDDIDPSHYLRTVRKHFVRDGMKVQNIYIDSQGEIHVDAAYEDD